MKAEIQEGRIFIIPESGTDLYALKKWIEDNVNHYPPTWTQIPLDKPDNVYILLELNTSPFPPPMSQPKH